MRHLSLLNMHTQWYFCQISFMAPCLEKEMLYRLPNVHASQSQLVRATTIQRAGSSVDVLDVLLPRPGDHVPSAQDQTSACKI